MTHDDPHSKAADAVHEGRPVEAQYARQGRGGVRIFWLLLVSVAAAAAVLLGLWFFSNGGFAGQNDDAGHELEDSRPFATDAGEIPNADAPTTTRGEPTAPPTGEAPNVNAPTETPPAQ